MLGTDSELLNSLNQVALKLVSLVLSKLDACLNVTDKLLHSRLKEVDCYLIIRACKVDAVDNAVDLLNEIAKLSFTEGLASLVLINSLNKLSYVNEVLKLGKVAFNVTCELIKKCSCLNGLDRNSENLGVDLCTLVVVVYGSDKFLSRISGLGFS